MEFKIRKFEIQDKKEILSMMEEFYNSDAVSTNGSKEIFETDFEKCLIDFPYLDGYVFCKDNIILGYSMIAKSFSTEFGKLCLWAEDLYVKKEYRGNGIIPKFIDYIKSIYPDSLIKLEVELENSHAVHVYKKCGFDELPYKEMSLMN